MDSAEMREALSALRAFYGPLASPPRDLFAFFVWEIVSARTLPARRDMAWQALKRVPALTPDAMFRASRASLEAALEMLTNREQRLDALRAGSGHFRRHRDLPQVVDGLLARAWRVLCDVPGLTPAARRRALLFAGGHHVAAVDDATARTIGRWRGVGHARPARLRRVARRRLIDDCAGDWSLVAEAVVVLGHHADHACAEQAHCTVCPMAPGCLHAAHPRPVDGVS